MRGIVRGVLVALSVGVGTLGILDTHLKWVQAKSVQIVLQDGLITPSTIQATSGEELQISVKNSGKNVHNLVIPDFYVFTSNLQPGSSTSVKFKPAKKGKFKYYSDKKSNQKRVPEPGMEGQLIVQ